MILHLLRDGRASMYVLCTTWIHSALRAEVRLMRRIRTKVHGIESETSDFQKRPKAQGLNFFHINRCLYIRWPAVNLGSPKLFRSCYFRHSTLLEMRGTTFVMHQAQTWDNLAGTTGSYSKWSISQALLAWAGAAWGQVDIFGGKSHGSKVHGTQLWSEECIRRIFNTYSAFNWLSLFPLMSSRFPLLVSCMLQLRDFFPQTPLAGFSWENRNLLIF